MPWAIQTVQAVVFTPDQPSAYGLFEAAFGRAPTTFQTATAPAIGTMASAVGTDGQRTIQVTPGRIDIFASPIPTMTEPVPFVPLPEPVKAKESLSAAAAAVAGKCSTVLRLAWVVRSVHETVTDLAAADLFSEYSGLPRARMSERDNFLQTNRPIEMPGLQDAVLNRLVQWRTETVQLLDISAVMGTAGVPTVTQRERHAISLNVDLNVIPLKGVLPGDRVGELVHDLARLSTEFAATDAPGIAV